MEAEAAVFLERGEEPFESCLEEEAKVSVGVEEDREVGAAARISSRPAKLRRGGEQSASGQGLYSSRRKKD